MSKKLTVDYSGGTYTIESSLSTDCKDGSVTFETSSDWITINGNSITIQETEASRSTTIHTFINFTDQDDNPQQKECGRYNIDVNQNGIPCDCESFDITDVITSIPSAGLSAQYPIFKCYPKGTACSLDGISGTLEISGVTHHLSLDGNDMKLQENIPKNTSKNSIPAVIKARYDDKDCLNNSISQEGISCDCSNLDSISLQLTKIDVTGLTPGEIGSYVCNEKVCDEFVGRIVNIGDSSKSYMISCSDNILTLEEDIPPNEDDNEKQFRVYIWYQQVGDSSNSCWQSDVITQPQRKCNCEDLVVKESYKKDKQ